MRKILLLLFCLVIPDMICADDDFGYTKKPNVMSTSSEPVLSFGGIFDVGALGNAVYSVPIEVPQGVGGMEPQISINYDSNGAYGLVGRSFNIGGLSCITRGNRTDFYDGKNSPLSFCEDDAYFLDGQRLILESGDDGMPNAKYSLANDPYTKAFIRGSYLKGSNVTHWEVHAKDGSITEYDAPVNYNSGSELRIYAWYITKVTDKLGNYMTYTYQLSGFTLYPFVISYGENVNSKSGLRNSVEFSYEPCPASMGFAFDNKRGYISNRLLTITTKTNGKVFRKYAFNYNNVVHCKAPISCLTSITMYNGKDEHVKPIRFEWNDAEFEMNVSNPLVENSSMPDFIKSKNHNFMCADLNGDGISDIIDVNFVDEKNGDYVMNTSFKIYTSEYSTVDNHEIRWKLKTIERSSYVDSDRSYDFQCVDFNGDGIQDLFLPYIVTGEKLIELKVLYGSKDKDISFNPKSLPAKSRIGVKKNSVFLQDGMWRNITEMGKAPLSVTGDFNNDGLGQFLFLFKNGNNKLYTFVVVKKKKKGGYILTTFKLELSECPERMFTADFNRDGFLDIIVVGKKGYKIFYNNGSGEDSDMCFSSESSKADTDLVWSDRMETGDFDGDGIMDFLTNKDEEKEWYVYYGESDGRFVKKKAFDTDVCQQFSTTLNDDKFSVFVYDMDKDGKSDVFINTSIYKQYVDSKAGNKIRIPKFDATYSFWYRSHGIRSEDAFEIVCMNTLNAEDDGCSKCFTVGDFTGDGNMDILNFGHVCYNNTDVSEHPSFHIYSSSAGIQCGRIKKITDAQENTVEVSYDSYAKEYGVAKAQREKNSRIIEDVDGQIVNVNSDNSLDKFPIFDVAYPLCTVKSVIVSNGVLGSQTSSYSYSNLKYSALKRGLMGFENTIVKNEVLNRRVETHVDKWNDDFFVPEEVSSYTYSGDYVASQTSVMGFLKPTDSKGQCFTYLQKKTECDVYGNKTECSYRYSKAIGLLKSETTIYDSNTAMRKNKEISEYVTIRGVLLPREIASWQNHADDRETSFGKIIKYEYDSLGLVKTKTEYSNEETEGVTTNYEYDVYGNVVSETVSGEDFNEQKVEMTYDKTGRFVVSKRTVPDTYTYNYSYDDYGNCISSKEFATSNAVKETKFEYDDWGHLVKRVNPNKTYETYSYGWDGKNTYVLTQGVGIPWKLTRYDSRGLKLSSLSVGISDISISETYHYDVFGNVVGLNCVNGDVSVSDTCEYDALGRVLWEKSSKGKDVTYKYENRKVISTVNGKEYVKEYDALGNIVRATDPTSVVEYRYNSNGKPSVVTCGRNTTKVEYDDFGNKVLLTTADAGTISYSYKKNGDLVSMTDADGVVTENTKYDSRNRVVEKKIGDRVITYQYADETSQSKNWIRYVEVKDGDKRICKKTYLYNKYGQVISKNMWDYKSNKNKTIFYNYNSQNQLVKVTYPNNVVVNYEYDCYGNKTKVYVNDELAWSFLKSTGSKITAKFCDDIYVSEQYDVAGRMVKTAVEYAARDLHKMTYEYDAETGNMTHRTGMFECAEDFEYDDLNRLMEFYGTDNKLHTVRYDDYGNIELKSNVGAYYYESLKSPNRLTSLDDGYSRFNDLSVKYNSQHRAVLVSDNEKGYAASFEYDEDGNRISSELKKKTSLIKSVEYFDGVDYVKSSGLDVVYYHLGDNLLYVLEEGHGKLYYICRDNLGSIVKLIDRDANVCFHARYDAWGVREVVYDGLGTSFDYGYTGEEEIPELGLVNLNARMYDPMLGRFISPDNYVQMPDFSQSFNRYAYCINNPLKFTDRSGEVFNLVVAAIIGGFINWGLNGHEWSWKGLGYFGVGAFAGAVGAGVGAGVNVAMAGGSFWSGAAGLASGVSSTGALAGAVSGASAGFSGGFIAGAGNSWNGGDKFATGLANGFKSGFMGALSGGITGGVMGGIDALDKGTNFWTGKAELSIEGAYSCSEYGSVVARQMEKSAQKFVLGKYVGKYEGVNVFETDMLGDCSIKGSYSGYTLPGHGIVVAKGVFTLGLKGDVGMMQHEFGHILQARKVGALGYYSIIAPESMHSAATNSVNGHREFWTEKWANYMSKNYFGSSWNVVVYVDKNNYYPVMDGYKIYLQKYNALLRSFIYPPHLPY